MKLSFILNEANFNPDELDTNASLTFEDGKIVSIDLILTGKVSKISNEKFVEFANEAKDNCPISSALNCMISVTASLI